ncbi:hypothetical protein CHGG_06850 [Chaetomium globosum CBS 148.51]|uniref:AMP-dependent synthetase/ligase domain-containing protein n=1 Tax=Chaetomium globosum (strain ATCC 6205 / CBS 148.51 / DSM 1962 / NBRC 6347 / NRRL 1970) TaxID=306901 RepID=Q2GYV4_CHAGB|nr:uncharacterized protein CHGG_06850 [Chaetomium globosum CBS 148.51]EAQ85597.1 hypothetical protein CHGG_06850 [Chaetomium globosum CBS 148.51]
MVFPVPIAAAAATGAGALAGAAYLNARFSLAHDLLFFRIFGATLFRLFRAGRAGRLNVFYVLEAQALDKTTGAKPFLLFEGRAVTYAETYETVLRYGLWLRECRGVREGDVVALDYQNSDTFVLLWFALWAVGAKPAFINYNLQGAALAHCLRASTAKLAIVDPRVAESVSEDVRREVVGMEFVVFTPELEVEAQGREPVRYPDAVRVEREPTDMAMLIYTSGTTGMPKPAIISWAKVYVAANMSSKGTSAKPSDVFYTRRLLSSSRQRAASWGHRGHRASLLHQNVLEGRALSSLRTTLVRVDNETELPWRDPKTGFCHRAKTGEAGEFIVRLPADDIKKRFQGYYGNAEATNSKIMRDVFRKGDAWFRSGDVLRWDSDGRVYFHDRIGDTFRWKSENVSTAEVAQILGLHPTVQEANVYGVQLPHHDGRAGCVAIVLDTPKANAQALASLASHAMEKLPRYAVPLFVRLVKELGAQTTGTNKQQKHVLRQQGVDPSKVEDDVLFWLKGGTYVPFRPADWKALEQGAVKL